MQQRRLVGHLEPGGPAPGARHRAGPDAGSTFYRWITDPATGKVTTESLNDLATEFPSINDAKLRCHGIVAAMVVELVERSTVLMAQSMQLIHRY